MVIFLGRLSERERLCTEEETVFCFTGESLSANKHLSPKLKYQEEKGENKSEGEHALPLTSVSKKIHDCHIIQHLAPTKYFNWTGGFP